VFKSLHAAHTGKLSFVRVWGGEIADGTTLDDQRISGINHVVGQKLEKQPKAVAGEVVALGRLDDAATGALLSPSGKIVAGDWPQPLKPLFALAVHAQQRADEVKLTSALGRLVDEDPSMSFGHDTDTGELLLWGQGEMQLNIALDRLRNRYNMEIASSQPQVPYKETIRGTVSQHARHKKQSGGHGEFGDVHLDIKPLPRGTGFEFSDTITGGAVPKNYIPAVEIGVKEYLNRGPLGFPVVDVAVTLTDGQFHTVDSSDMAFRKAAALGMREGMPKCGPVLLEPIFNVRIAIPSEFTSRIQRLVSGRRGQILGFGPKADWNGWDEVSVLLPQSEIYGLIIELRSATLGVGTFEWTFDHLQELTGRLADEVVARRAEAD
jgi:elongation factor G